MVKSKMIVVAGLLAGLLTVSMCACGPKVSPPEEGQQEEPLISDGSLKTDEEFPEEAGEQGGQYKAEEDGNEQENELLSIAFEDIQDTETWQKVMEAWNAEIEEVCNAEYQRVEEEGEPFLDTRLPIGFTKEDAFSEKDGSACRAGTYVDGRIPYNSDVAAVMTEGEAFMDNWIAWRYGGKGLKLLSHEARARLAQQFFEDEAAQHLLVLNVVYKLPYGNVHGYKIKDAPERVLQAYKEAFESNDQQIVFDMTTEIQNELRKLENSKLDGDLGQIFG